MEEKAFCPVYPVVWLDAIHYKAMQNGKSVTRAIYNVIGLGLDGKKHILGMYKDQSESATFWITVKI